MDCSNYWSEAMRSRLSRRRLFKAGVATGAWCIGMALGCNNSTTTTPSATSQAGTEPAAGASAKTVTPQATIRRGGKLRFAYTLDASSLDPHTGTHGGDHWYFYAMFDNLIAYDQNFESRPEISLAESWEFPDDTTMIFKLRRGVKFHDGTPFNAEAVKINIERQLDPKTKATNRAEASVIARVDVVNDYTAKFILQRPSSSLIALLGDRVGTMNSPTALDKYGDQYMVHPVGTGPFQFVEWVKGSYVAMKRFPDYWGKDQYGNQLPYLDEVKVSLITDSTVSYANLQTGDLDVALVTPKELDSLKRNKNLATEDFEGGSIPFIVDFNIAKPPMDDLNLRLAVCYAIDPEAINNAVWFGDNTVAKGGMYPPRTWVYNESAPRPFYDPKKAKEYLAKAGKPNGFSMPMLTPSRPEQVQGAEMVQAQLSEVGIKVELTVMENAQAAVAFFEEGRFPAGISNWPRRPEPDTIASRLYKSDAYYNASKTNYGGMLDALIEKGASVYDIEERKRIYNQINEYILGNAIWLPLIYGRVHAGYNVRVQNMRTFWGAEAVARYKELWIKD